MPFVLVTLLLFALLVTLAGFLLSARPQSNMQHVVLSRPPIARRIGGTVHQPPPRYTRAPVQRATRAMLNPSIGIYRGRRQAGEPVRWSVIVIGLVSVFVLGLFTLGKVFPHSAVLNPVWFADGSQPTPAANQKEPLSGTSQRLVRIGQLDPAQYNSPQEYNTWAYSACSAAAMTEVFNAYGRHYRVTDVLKVEAQIGAITPQLGLVEDSGIQRTAAQFGFKTTWGHNLSLDQVISTATRGEPVIVSFPPDRYAGGHILAVIGGDSQTVLLADTSRWNRHSLSRSQFLAWWEGFSAVVTPN